MQTAIAMDDVTTVRQAVGSLIEGEIEPLLNLLTDNVEFEVVRGDDATATTDYGQQVVAEYFTTLGGFVAFWQVDYTAANRQVIAWGKESFTIQGTDLEGGCEFALVFDLADGMVTRLAVIEDLSRLPRMYPSFPRRSASVIPFPPRNPAIGVAPMAASK